MRAHSRSRTKRAQCHSYLAPIAVRNLSAIRINLRLDLSAYLRHHRGARIAQTRQPRPASQASAESSLFRRVRQRKKFYLLAPRFPRSARRLAINSCGSHRIHKRAVCAAIPRLHSAPPLRVRKRRVHRAKIRIRSSRHQFNHCEPSSPIQTSETQPKPPSVSSARTQLEVFHTRVNIHQCAEGEHPFAFVCLSRSANKPQTQKISLLALKQLQLPLNHSYLSMPCCCIIGHPPVTSLDAALESAHIRSTGRGEVRLFLGDSTWGLLRIGRGRGRLCRRCVKLKATQ